MQEPIEIKLKAKLQATYKYTLTRHSIRTDVNCRPKMSNEFAKLILNTKR